VKEPGTVVITGASAGIGRATARLFGRHGWRVALLARGVDGLEAAAAEIRASGGEALVLPLDVADASAVEEAAARVERELGPIDVWINNAMATIFCDVSRTAAADFRRATEVTYLGTVWGTLAAIRRMMPRDRGTVVQVGSALAYRSIPLQAAYCGAKSAIRGFTDALRSELIHEGSGVHVTMVQLSAFNTPQFSWARTCMPHRPRPLGAVSQPEIAARAIWWAARHRRRELWVGWSAIKAIVGTRIVPGWLDRLLAHRAWDGQFGEQPLPSGRPDNLFAPVGGDHGAHGRFDAQASAHAPQLWLDTHRRELALAACAAAAGAWWLRRRRR
jgi:short-subunit dehydrogenase